MRRLRRVVGEYRPGPARGCPVETPVLAAASVPDSPRLRTVALLLLATGHWGPRVSRPRMNLDARSAIIITGALGLPETSRGMIEASTTRMIRSSKPRRGRSSTRPSRHGFGAKTRSGSRALGRAHRGRPSSGEPMLYLHRRRSCPTRSLRSETSRERGARPFTWKAGPTAVRSPPLHARAPRTGS